MNVKRGLPPEAYEEVPGETYPPYVPRGQSPPEFTMRTLILGSLFGIVFGSANAFLGLRVGLTISTSIPVAVMTVLAFALLPRRSDGQTTILEANMSQTIGSASSSVASGLIFTIPALYLWQVVPSLPKMTVIALTGGLLGVLFMVPLRRFLMLGEHGRLPYPEGTACAEVLVASEVGGAKAREVFLGLGVGAIYRLLQGALHLWRGELSVRLPLLPKAEVALETSPALLGVGFILGPRIANVMVGGSLLSWVILIPAIAWIGGEWTTPLYPETEALVRDMEPGTLWTRYIRYVGAGAVAMAGIMTLIHSIPTMTASIKLGMEQLRRRVLNPPAGAQSPEGEPRNSRFLIGCQAGWLPGPEVARRRWGPAALIRAASRGGEETARTDRDIPMKWVFLGSAAAILFLAFVPHVLGFLEVPLLRVVAAGMVAVFAFLFVTVSSRIVGLVGVTSNPTSGMTIATLLGTSGLFLAFGWTDLQGQAAALTVGAVVAIAASVAGDMSQDLKTGFLLGATPSRQQVGELVGVLTSAFFVALTLSVLSQAYGFGTRELPAPQANMMKIVIEGVLSQNLPWLLVGIGAVIAILTQIAGIPSLAFAVGIYLPLATMSPVFVGGFIRWITERRARNEDERRDRRERGILFGSGLVGGEGLLGVGIAAYAVLTTRAPGGFGSEWAGSLEPWVPVIPFAFLIWMLWRAAQSGAKSD